MSTLKRIGATGSTLLLFVLVNSGPVEAGKAKPGPGTLRIANVAKDPTQVGVPVAGRKTPTTITVNLVAAEAVAELAPGKEYYFWTFAVDPGPAGKPQPTVPGPMIRVMEGDTVVLNLRNGLSAAPSAEPHNIDFHAVMGPGGGAAATNVMPGEIRTLSFKAMRAGAYIYHCAGEGMPWEHVSHGMYGLIMVEPVGGLPMQTADRRPFKEFYIGQSEWYVLEPGYPWASTTYYDLDDAKALAEHPDHFTLNGHTAALTDAAIFGGKMRVNVGDAVRMFVVTGGPNVGSNFHIIGQIFDQVYPGHPSTPIRNEETTYVPPGSATVVEMTALVPGKYLLVDHALWRVVKGAAGHLWVDPQCGDPSNCSWPRDIYSPAVTGTGH